MRPRLAKPALMGAAGAGLVVLLTGVLAFGPLVRARASAEAARRRLHLTIGAVRPSWRGIRLSLVNAGLDGVDGVDVRFDDVRIDLSWTLRPVRIVLAGGMVLLSGSDAKLRTSIEAWRQHQSDPTAAIAAHAQLSWAIHGVALRWDDGEPVGRRVEASGIDAISAAGETQIEIFEAHAHSGPWLLSLSSGRVDVSRGVEIGRARFGAVVAQWLAPPASPGESRTSSREQRAGKPSEPALIAAAAPASPRASTRARVEALPSPDAEAPLWAPPDLHALQARVAFIEEILSARVARGADLGVDALTWKVARAGDHAEPAALTIGPGPLSASRLATGFEAHFSADPKLATTPLAVRVVLPTDGSDPSISLDGGPISLSMLGIREGTADLVDVSSASVTCRTRAVLARDGSALTFDGEIGTRALSIDSRRLAPDVVRDLDIKLRARGVLTSEGKLRVDDLSAAVGAIRLDAAGGVDQTSEHWVGSFRFESPVAGCQSLLNSLPPQLLPDLQGTKLSGTFGMRGHVAFDSHALDLLELDYDVADLCRMVDVPAWLSRDQFEHPFAHRIYLPDGSMAEQTTGPGTSNWTPLEDISPYMQVAVLTTEDGAFARHHGFSRASIRASIIANLKARSFVRGASTITMQLAKNLFLSRDKTLSRKLEEVVLTEYLEQTFSKNELMELYLNVIEFGPAVYGITAAADYYFGRTPAELNLAECLFLSSILPSPRRYGLVRDSGVVPDGWLRTLHVLMNVAHRTGRISDVELAEAEDEPITFWTGGDKPAPRPAVQARPHLGGEDTGDVTTDPADGARDGP